MVDGDKWLSVQDVVEALAVHEQTVRRWIKTGDLPAVALGDRAGYRVAAADLQAFMERRRVVASGVAADPKIAA